MCYAVGMVDIMDTLTFTKEEGLAAIEAGKKKRAKSDPRICVCGHTARAHTSEAPEDHPLHSGYRKRNDFACAPGQQECPCKKFVPVLTTKDPRKFIFKTDGSGAAHALAKGIVYCRSKGIELETLPDWKCARCGKHGNEVGLTPVVFNTDLVEVEYPTPGNLLLCEADREVLRQEAQQRVRAQHE